MLFICYPPCGTCQKAMALLDALGARYDFRDIKLERPSEAELRVWHKKSGLPLKRFFNTNGLAYKALGLAQKLPFLSEEEQFSLLASDGMLVKRPLLLADDSVLIGFQPKEWEESLARGESAR